MTPYQLQHAAAVHRLDLNMKDQVKSTKIEFSIIGSKNDHPPPKFEPGTSNSTVHCFYHLCYLATCHDNNGELFYYKMHYIKDIVFLE